MEGGNVAGATRQNNLRQDEKRMPAGPSGIEQQPLVTSVSGFSPSVLKRVVCDRERRCNDVKKLRFGLGRPRTLIRR